MRFTTDMTRKQFIILTSLLVGLMAYFVWGVTKKDPLPQNEENYIGASTFESITSSPTMSQSKPPVVKAETVSYTDENNSIPPYNTMSADWGAEVYESGFRYYNIPQEYKDYGGCFPEVVQVYLWETCRNTDIDYYIVLALIERESKYKWDATGDNGNSKGYMQIYERWHKDRMTELGVTDLYNPYQNIVTGVNYLAEIAQKYKEDGYNTILMVYNMGESGAKRNWKQGVYSTAYSRGILERAQEIKQEIQD